MQQENLLRNFLIGVQLQDRCPAPMKTLHRYARTCINASVPLSALTGPLSKNGLEILANPDGFPYPNPIKLWGLLFLLLMGMHALAVLIHDLTLLQEAWRPEILTLRDIETQWSRLWVAVEWLQCRRTMRGLRKSSRILCLAITPFWLLLQAVIFIAICLPTAIVVSCSSPCSMSRFGVLTSGVICVLLASTMMIFFAFSEHTYTVWWESERDDCVCLCQFPLSREVSTNLILLGLATCWQACAFSWRAIKGLRRRQWANLFSVLYTVPIEAFPVHWVGRAPARFREKDEPVQDEPAFDPFCLMDEQPDSAQLYLSVQPSVKADRILEGAAQHPSEIGRCGFPLSSQLVGIASCDVEEDLSETMSETSSALVEARADDD